MKEQDWEKVKDLFDSLWGIVELECDGYKITLQVQKVKKLQLGIFVFVNGEIKGTFITTDCEERRRFYPSKDVCVHTKKERERLLKIFGKKDYEKRSFDRKIKMHGFSWTSFSKLKKHFVDNNKEIKFIERYGL